MLNGGRSWDEVVAVIKRKTSTAPIPADEPQPDFVQVLTVTVDPLELTLTCPATKDPLDTTALLAVLYGFLSVIVFTAPVTAFAAVAGQS